jgi:hypothetical protein
MAAGRAQHRLSRVAHEREHQRVPNCSGGFIQHIDGTIADCTLDDDADGCVGLELATQFAEHLPSKRNH